MYSYYHNSSRKKKTMINTIAGIINSFCNSILSFVLRTVFIITLGIEYTGISSVFTAILTMLSLSELGIGTAIATALYKPLKEHDEEQIRKLMYFYKMAYRYIACFILVTGITLTPFLDYIINKVPNVTENLQVIFMCYIVKTALSYLMIYKSTLLNADQKQYITKIYETICTFIRYFLEIISLFVFKDFMTYLIIEVISIIIQNYIITHQAETEYPFAFQTPKIKLSNSEKKKLFKDIKGLAMYSMSGSIGKSIDNILISSFINTVMAGFLSNYTLIKQQIELMLKQFFNALTPSIGNLAAEDDNKKQLTIFYEVIYVSFILVNFCSVSMFVLFNPFIEMWLGKEYLLGNEIAFIIALDFFLYIFLQAIASFRTANGLFVRGQYRPLITTILNVVLSLLLIKPFGIFGTIFATVICRFTTQWYDPYLLFKYVFHASFRKFCVKYFIYITLFLICCQTTLHISQTIVVDNIYVKFITALILCMLLPNSIVIMLTFRFSEFQYFKNIVSTKAEYLVKHK